VTQMSECQICEKHKQGVQPIYEDQDWMVTLGPLGSQILGYLYIEPKKHIENWSDFSDDELAKVGPLIKRLEQAVKNELNIDRVYVVTISEAVRHLHFHIIPRLEGSDVKGLALIEQATQQKGKNLDISAQDYQAFIDKLRTSFAKSE
jgi:diadenosine tetraphosphate (Ap4A) HIT family hydrolase